MPTTAASAAASTGSSAVLFGKFAPRPRASTNVQNEAAQAHCATLNSALTDPTRSNDCDTALAATVTSTATGGASTKSTEASTTSNRSLASTASAYRPCS